MFFVQSMLENMLEKRNDIFQHTFPTCLFSNIFTLLRLHIAFKVSTPNVCIKNRIEEEDPEAQINDCHADSQHTNDGSNESFDSKWS